MSLSVSFGQALWYNQRILMYPAAFCQPRHVNEPKRPFQHVEIATSDKVILRCFLITHKNARANVIVFHGNAMNHGDMAWHAEKFYSFRCNVLTVSYRGYGYSDGKPSEKGLRKDAWATLNYLRNDTRLSSLPIVIYGCSLGGAVAIDLASRHPSEISALILENTFISVPNLVREWGMLKYVAWLCTQKWDSASKIVKIPPTIPILFLSGRRDSVVPPMHMDRLQDLARTRANSGHPPIKDMFRGFPEGEHHDTWTCPGYWEVVRNFLDHCLLEK